MLIQAIYAPAVIFKKESIQDIIRQLIDILILYKPTHT